MRDKVGQDLLDLEAKYWQAIKNKDIETAPSLTGDPCIVVGSGGVQTIAKAKFREIMQSATHRLSTFELPDEESRSLRDDVGVLHEEMVVDGKPVKIEEAHSSTWTKKNGHWVCAVHTESISGDPFGLDRRV